LVLLRDLLKSFIFKISSSFQKRQEKQNKDLIKKTGILTENQFLTKLIRFFSRSSKTNNHLQMFVLTFCILGIILKIFLLLLNFL